jgi:serine/threonine-protein kinase ATR
VSFVLAVLIVGVFRKAAEIAMSILRANSESLMSVLEAFAHDPLVEWQQKSVCQRMSTSLG